MGHWSDGDAGVVELAANHPSQRDTVRGIAVQAEAVGADRERGAIDGRNTAFDDLTELLSDVLVTFENGTPFVSRNQTAV
jgi:hypothetical protein